MKVTDYKVKDDKLTLYLDGDEKLIGNYYFEDFSDIEQIEYGDCVRLKGNLKLPSNNTIPHTFNYKKYLQKKNINYILSIQKIEVVKKPSFIYKVKNWINDRITKIDSTGYMKAFILGDKSVLEEDEYNNYKSIGISHLFAISGMHIGLLSEILLKVLKRLKKGLKYLVIDAFLITYGFIVCFPASIKRCILFYIINSINKIFDLGLNNKQILLFTVSILILIDPYILYDTGFLFSVCTVGGIIICCDFIKDYNKFKEAFKLSLVAFLFSLPINLYTFYEINILSVFYNMVFIPFISIIVYPLSLISFVFPFVNNVFQYSIKILEWSSGLLSSIKIFRFYLSFNIIEVCIFYLFLIVLFNKRQKRYICCLFLVFMLDLIAPYFDCNAYVYYLDVGQGDATLLISPYRKKVYLIDTGGIQDYHVSDNYVNLFKYLGIKYIDYLILTHGDFDHMGEAEYLLDNIDIKKIIFNCGSFNELETNLIDIKINYYDCVNRLDNLYFLNSTIFNDENNDSNIIYTKIYNYKFLFMGDAGKERERLIIRDYNLNNVDFLKVGHHGSDTSSSNEFISTINPKYSIISVGRKNRYGHPKKSVLNTLKNTKIFRTDKDGSIVIRVNKNGYKIETYSP